MERKVESKGLGVNGSDLERGNVARHEDGGGIKGLGKQRGEGEAAYLLCPAGLHDIDRMADQRGCCPGRK